MVGRKYSVNSAIKSVSTERKVGYPRSSCKLGTDEKRKSHLLNELLEYLGISYRNLKKITLKKILPWTNSSHLNN